jgi:hypothetical protein
MIDLMSNERGAKDAGNLSKSLSSTMGLLYRILLPSLSRLFLSFRFPEVVSCLR